MFSRDLLEKLTTAGIVAVVTVENPRDGVEVARALLDGGISTIELTFRTAVAAETIRRIRSELPEILIGAGTVLNAADVDMALRAGALFGVSPGCNPRTIRTAADRGLPFAPGVMTPSDIETAVECNCNVLKFFPAQSAGGVRHLQAMAAPFSRLGLRFIPLGGIDGESLAPYFRYPEVICVGGSWFAPADLIRRKDWAEIRRRAGEATDQLATLRAASPIAEFRS